MPYFDHSTLRFHFREAGAGSPFVFQHGLGADVEQPLGLLEGLPGVRLIAMDCRAHGQTEPLGPVDQLNVETFAADVAALMNHLGVERAAVGGISMGAALSLQLALRLPDRVAALVLSRPAWSVGPNQANARRFAEVARLLRDRGAEAGKRALALTADFRQMQVESPDAARSLLGQFDSPQCVQRAARLEEIPKHAALPDRACLARLQMPVLVLAHRLDPIHELAHGETLAAAIPQAEFHEITPKSRSVDQHVADVRRHISQFLARHGLSASAATPGRGA